MGRGGGGGDSFLPRLSIFRTIGIGNFIYRDFMHRLGFGMRFNMEKFNLARWYRSRGVSYRANRRESVICSRDPRMIFYLRPFYDDFTSSATNQVSNLVTLHNKESNRASNE